MQEVFEKIIEKLEIEEVQAYAKTDGGATYKAFRNAIEIVEQEATEYSNGWIPCSERLPEEKINPVTKDYYQYPVMFENDGVKDIKYYYFGNGHWRYGLRIMDNYVTHWMDIKPYQPKEVRVNCMNRHENGNCLAVGGFCTAVDDKHCKYQPKGE